MSDFDIDVRIDEIVLDGLDPRDRDAIGEAIRSELVRLVGEAASTDRRFDPDREHRLERATLELDAHASGHDIGARVASLLFDRLAGVEPPEPGRTPRESDSVPGRTAEGAIRASTSEPRPARSEE